MNLIIVPNPITNSFIKQHPSWTFVYGYDVVGKGAFGQAVAAKDEPNAFPVFTTRNGCKSSGYFQDSMFEEIVVMNTAQLMSIRRHAEENANVIIPFPKIGRGHSRMFEFAPKSYKWLIGEIDKIKYPNLQRKYGLNN